jgi:hypothetical protein
MVRILPWRRSSRSAVRIRIHRTRMSRAPELTKQHSTKPPRQQRSAERKEPLVRVIQHADELADFVAICWKDGKQPLSAQVKKGLAAACVKFSGYQFAKYDPAASVRASARRALSSHGVRWMCSETACRSHAAGAGEAVPPGRPERKGSARSQGPNPIVPTDEHSGGVNL